MRAWNVVNTKHVQSRLTIYLRRKEQKNRCFSRRVRKRKFVTILSRVFWENKNVRCKPNKTGYFRLKHAFENTRLTEEYGSAVVTRNLVWMLLSGLLDGAVERTRISFGESPRGRLWVVPVAILSYYTPTILIGDSG